MQLFNIGSILILSIAKLVIGTIMIDIKYYLIVSSHFLTVFQFIILDTFSINFVKVITAIKTIKITEKPPIILS